MATLVFLPGGSHWQRNLAGYRPWGHKESDMTGRLSTHTRMHTWVSLAVKKGSNIPTSKVKFELIFLYSNLYAGKITGRYR